MMFPFNGQEFFINNMLAGQLNTLIYNIKNDWDFIILITGDRMVRIGKSVLGHTVAAYITYGINRYLKLENTFELKDLYWKSKNLMVEGLKRPKHSVLVYEEAREALSNTKMFSQIQNDLIDFFAECGQLNHIIIVIMDDFFALPEAVAVGRSEVLINVYREDQKMMVDMFNDGIKVPVVRFKRGQFDLYNRYEKQKLYDMAKRMRTKHYGLVRPGLPPMNFTNQYVLDETEYRRIKKEYLISRGKDRDLEFKASKTDIFRDRILVSLSEQGKTSDQIKKLMKDTYEYDISSRQIRFLIQKWREKQLLAWKQADLAGVAGDTVIQAIKT